ncbi:hypothetical protein TIFTF001_027010 [Ficus carica]|uniref:Uncharacterized protein n=1 Tax=Ficus carica TaxID=3494 RepID=A0AA88IYZ0_FICCA|nr:hypothetical protein TIFTF001_027010 [Ficus carica]
MRSGGFRSNAISRRRLLTMEDQRTTMQPMRLLPPPTSLLLEKMDSLHQRSNMGDEIMTCFSFPSRFNHWL